MLLLVVVGYMYVSSFFFFLFNKRNPFLVLIVLELQLILICLLFCFFAYLNSSVVGYTIVLFVVAFAGAEASVGVSLLILYYRLRGLLSLEFPVAVSKF